jgi:hypothetical protein
MASARKLDSEHAEVSPGRIVIPLAGTGDDPWLDRFYAARGAAVGTRRRGNLPHLQIELHHDEIVVTEVPAGEEGAVKALLGRLVAAANKAR